MSSCTSMFLKTEVFVFGLHCACILCTNSICSISDEVKYTQNSLSSHSPSSDHPDGDGLLQLPGRGIDDVTAHLDPLAAHPRPVEDVHLEKTWYKNREQFKTFCHLLGWQDIALADGIRLLVMKRKYCRFKPQPALLQNKSLIMKITHWCQFHLVPLSQVSCQSMSFKFHSKLMQTFDTRMVQ